VLGSLPGQPQPSQKRFETLLWDSLHGFDPAREVFVESESRTIGRLRVPEGLLAKMRDSPCVVIEMPATARVDLLMQDYAHFLRDTEALCERLEALREARGAAVVERWQALARDGQLVAVVQDLLADHYDPIYLRSMARNYVHFTQARELQLPDGSPRALARLAQQLLGAGPGRSGNHP
jgi:tRNA 2-selenouridine synthase